VRVLRTARETGISRSALFWIGDLNYRINLPDDTVKQLVEKSQWHELLQADQVIGDANHWRDSCVCARGS
jgi:hypothetical protein